MLNLLVNKFIPDHDNTKDPRVRSRYGTLAGAVGILLNSLLAAGKFAAGMISGSIAITADALNNLQDAASSIITLIGFHVAGRQADAEHPFGHGRMEYVTGMVVSLLIIVMGFELGRDSLSKVLHPSPTSTSLLILAILGVSILVKFYMYLYNHDFAKKLDSEALASTASDSRNDMISTAAVMFTQIICAETGVDLDGWCGLGIAAFILYSGLMSMRDTTDPLLGKEPDPALVQTIEDTVASYHNVLGMHDLVIHDYGPGRRMMSLHIEVPSDMTLVDAHELADKIELRLSREYNLSTVIHVDPIDVADPETQRLHRKIAEFLAYLGPDFLFHDLRIVPERNRKKVLFDVNVPFGVKMTDEEITAYLKDHIQALDPAYRPIIGIDHYDKTPS